VYFKGDLSVYTFDRRMVMNYFSEC